MLSLGQSMAFLDNGNANFIRQLQSISVNYNQWFKYQYFLFNCMVDQRELF